MERYDFAVVGAGIAGLAVGYELATQGTVAVLESLPAPASGATGRSAALISPAFKPPMLRALVEASLEFYATPPEGLFESAPLRGSPGRLMVARGSTASDLDRIARSEPAGTVRTVEIDEAREMCPMLRPDYGAAALFESACHEVDVQAVAHGLARAIRASGGVIETDAEVRSLRHNGSEWIIRTPRLEIAAGIVVNAAGHEAPALGGIAGAPAVGIEPKLRSACIVAVGEGQDVSGLPFVIDRTAGFWFKPEGPNLMVSLSGGRTPEPGSARASTEDNARAIDLLEAATTVTGRRVMGEWGAVLAYTIDGRPIVGRDEVVPGFHWVAGLGSSGVMTAPAVARLAAAQIIEGEGDTADVETEELAPGRFRR